MFDYNNSDELYELMMKAKEIRKKYFNMKYTTARRYDIAKFMKKSTLLKYDGYWDDTLIYGKFKKNDVSEIKVNLNQQYDYIFAAAYMLVCLENEEKINEEIVINHPQFKNNVEIRRGLIASYVLAPQEVVANDIQKEWGTDSFEKYELDALASWAYTVPEIMEIRLKAEGYSFIGDGDYEDYNDKEDPEDDFYNY